MQTIDLGFDTPDYSKMSGPCCAESSSKDTPTKRSYPCLTIPGNADLARTLKPGQEVTALVKFKVVETAIREREGDKDKYVEMYGGTHTELEAQSITFKDLTVEPSEEDGSSAFKKFMAGKKAKTENSDE